VSARRIIIDWNSIESKWINRWEEQRIFEADPDSCNSSRKKYFVTVAYPYPNSPQHLGHGRTYTLADAHARYMRMKGCNVLFPMGFHYTGTPILGMSRRVTAGDAELMETFHKIYKLSDDVIATFIEPVNIARYFHQEIKRGMKEMGYSIDWRREFTTIDKMYSKFISWQFRTLRKKGLIVQGSHPVGWCPRDQNPVSQHDTIGDVEPDFNEYTLIKFRSGGVGGGNWDGNIMLPAATLRPETLFGVTNVWVNPDVDYVHAQVDGEKWIISTEAARKMKFLNHKIEIIKMVKGSEMIGWKATNPVNNASVPIYPASFVEADSGTGIVMSVPAHAPYDYQALEDLKADKKLQQKFHISVDDNDNNVRPIKIIQSELYSGSIPAAEAIKQVDHYGQNNHERLEKATGDLYSHEFYKGIMMHNTGRFAGMAVAVAKNEVKLDVMRSGMADTMYELVNKPVRCRCGAECVVKLLSDQWFLNYSDKEWKGLAHECVSKMDIVPHDIRQEFDYVIDWLRERACARKSGLGTKLPWDEEWTIESLSDSVIYMAYYVIAKYVNSKAISDDDDENNNNVTDAFFDYVLLGAGSADQVAKECGIPVYMVEQIRNEFSYFYPVDSRHSGRDLVPNHLTFFIFNHVAIFDKKNWPRQIVVNGSVLMEGKKMSKSLGNIIPLRAAIREHGADTIRLAMLMSAEILQDADFSLDTVRGIRLKLLGIFEMAEKCSSSNSSMPQQEKEATEQQLLLEDKWLVSRLQRTIAETSASMDRLRIREAIHHTLYSLDQDLQWYLKRVAAKGRENVSKTLAHFLNIQVRMLAPFAPFTAEEVWERMGNGQSIAIACWPVAEEGKIDIVAEESEFLISGLLADLQNIVKVTKMTPTKIFIYTSAGWKTQVYKAILANILEGRINFGEIMKQLIVNPETAKAKTDPKLVQKMMEDILSAPLEARSRRLKLTEFDEITAIYDAQSLVSAEINKAQIVVYSEEDSIKYDPKSRAKSARPFKPAIYIE
jgi:leucyl-tRNA synthetase